MKNDESGIIPIGDFKGTVCSNVKSDVIIITEVKLENILIKHKDKLTENKAWMTPVINFGTILLVFLTTEFKDFIGISKYTWQAIFIISLIVTLIWSIWSIIRSIKSRKKAALDFLIKEIKNNVGE
jgi:hypothetical protein